MHFIQQNIVTFALLSICAYANPMGNQLEVSGQLMIREQVTWCGGMNEGECQEHCRSLHGKYAQYKCQSEYVNLKY